MKKGDTIKGPAIIRRTYHEEWEYALLLPNGQFMPFGKHAPSAVKWVYQVTWKDTLQKIVTLKSEDNQWPNYTRMPEKDCWWITRHEAPDVKPFLDILLPLHAGKAPKL